MSIDIASVKSSAYYSLNFIQEEVRQLIEGGVVSRQQPIYTLCRAIPARDWVQVERELERHDYLLRDRINDLVGSQEWDND